MWGRRELESWASLLRPPVRDLPTCSAALCVSCPALSRRSASPRARPPRPPASVTAADQVPNSGLWTVTGPAAPPWLDPRSSLPAPLAHKAGRGRGRLVSFGRGRRVAFRRPRNRWERPSFEKFLTNSLALTTQGVREGSIKESGGGKQTLL